MTRMFGADVKLSFHASGRCQWSATDAWIKKKPEKRNAQRHIVRWTLPPMEQGKAIHVFRIQIPEAELRRTGDGENVSGITWLPAPPFGHAAFIQCYITPVC